MPTSLPFIGLLHSWTAVLSHSAADLISPAARGALLGVLFAAVLSWITRTRAARSA